ncbi:MAG: glycerophosphodiester phosphodiesterase [Myxococcota bacterium]
MQIIHPFFDLPRPVSIGHRGCAGEAPENTTASFERALEQGAAILESDVHLTRDGVPVLIHDPLVDRVTEQTGSVSKFDFARLQSLDAAYRFSRNDGQSFPFRGAQIRIPSVDQAFARFPNARFNLELKSSEPGLVDAVVALIVRLGREDLTLLTAGDAPIMTELRTALDKLDKPIAQGASTGDVLDFIRSATDGTPPRPGPMALQIPANFAGRPLVTRELVQHAHAHAVHVHAWTINDPVEMAELLELGVDGIISDFPARLGKLVAGAAS